MDQQEQNEMDAAKRSGQSALGKAIKDEKKKATRKMVVNTMKTILLPILIKAIIILPIIVVIFSIVDFLSNDASGENGYSSVTYNGTLTGDSKEEQIWNFLIANGATKVGAAAMMGNMKQENYNFDPTVENEIGAFGICQWYAGRRTNLQNYATSKGTTESDFQTQLEFLIKELNEISSYKKTKDIVFGATDASKLYACDTTRSTCTCCITTIIRDNFEIPGYGTANGSYEWLDRCVPNRKKWAKEFYEKFKDLEPPSLEEDIGEVSGSQGGEWKKFRIDNKIIGSFKSAITEKTFYIYNQAASRDAGTSGSWGVWCNRAATICLCSGYYAKNTDGAIELFWKANNAGYDINCQSFYNSYGLTRTSIGNGYSNNKANLRTALKSGKYGLIYIRNSSYYGASGQKWASTAHWLPIIGYQVVDGKEQIFVSDPGHGGTGWYSINEFNSATKVDFYIVSKK